MFTQRVRLSAATLFLTVTLATHAQDTALQSKIDAMIHEPQVAHAHWGIHVTKLDGTPIVAINEGQLFEPASNNKLFTTATVMALMPAGTLNTKVKASVPVDTQGVVRGDLLLIGAGDANFSGRTLPYVPPAQRPKNAAPPNELRFIDELADQVKAAGVKRVDGNIVGDDTLLPWAPYANNWGYDDFLWYYGAPVNALMIADNAINVKVQPGERIGSPATILLNPSLPYYTIQNNITTIAKGAEGHIDLERDLGSKTVRFYGTIAEGSKHEEDIAIQDPAEYAALALKAALEVRGIEVKGSALPKHRFVPEFTFTRSATEPLKLPLKKQLGTNEENFPLMLVDADKLSDSACGSHSAECRTLATHDGGSLYDDIVVTNKISQNQHAELFLRMLGRWYGTEGSTAQGVRVVRAFLTDYAGVNPDDFIFFDGSGMSSHDLVAPRATTQLLRYAITQPWGEKWKASLPIAGEDGSLRSRFPKEPLKGHVHAKTGTLSEARALSGYLDCSSGQTVVFSIMVNNHTPRTHEDEKTMDAIVAAIQAAE